MLIRPPRERGRETWSLVLLPFSAAAGLYPTHFPESVCFLNSRFQGLHQATSLRISVLMETRRF